MIRNADNKGADQSARMRRLVCAFDVCNPLKSGFLASMHMFTCLYTFYRFRTLFIVCSYEGHPINRENFLIM